MPPTNHIAGRIVLVDRGVCSFTIKAGNIQQAGGVAIILANSVPGEPTPMGTESTPITIPLVGTTQDHGAHAKRRAVERET